MKFKLFAIATALAFSTFTANAQDTGPDATNGTGYAGILIGYADPTNIDGRQGYGVDIGLMFPSGLTGLIFGYSSTDETDGIDNTITQYGLGADMSLGHWFGEG